MLKYRLIWCLALCGCFSGGKREHLELVSVEQFGQFVAATGYTTDAEEYAWSIVQRDVDHFDVVEGVDWRCPDGEHEQAEDWPVTQVSYDDALAYAKWRGVRLPSYAEYWLMLPQNDKPINKSTTSIQAIDAVQLLGNTWEITEIDALGRVRLAGGSYLCDDTTCNGTSQARELYVDRITGNSHIGFAVVVDN